MLKHLYIKNFTLINELDIGLYPGFSVITGETGAGKSIILGAIHLLLGQRADTKQIKSGKDKCIVEAVFDLSKYHLQPFFEENDIEFDAGECIVRREVNASGKSRAFINDTPVPLTAMRELGDQLIDIHSQHQSLLLQKEDFQLNVIDIIAQDKPLLAQYQEAYQAFRQAKKACEDFEQEYQQSRENEEFLRFQWNELDDANLQEGEQEDLEQQQQLLTHAEDIKSALYTAAQALHGEPYGAIEQMRAALDQIEKVAGIAADLQELRERIDSAYIDIKDIAQEVNRKADGANYNPDELQAVNQRLDQIYTLQRKHHADTVEQLIEKRDAMAAQLNNIDGGTERLQQLQAAADAAQAQCMQAAQALSKERKKAAGKVEKDLKQRLVPLGIPNVKFAIDFKEKACSASGIDNVQFLFNANGAQQLQPISQVASGGEIARIMLSLKAMISGAVRLPTIIFDEIDTGVSGRIAEKMAEIMQEMGRTDRQVISITHLPQIAALGAVHYKVSKHDTPEGTTSRMQQLTAEERVNELAQMLSGSDITPAAIENAKALLSRHNP